MSIPIFEVQFDKDAKLVQPSQEQDVITALTAPGSAPTDVIVLSHGWNNDMDEARTLYRDFLRCLEPLAPGKKLVAIGILWPSKKFADADLISGGAASIDGNDSSGEEDLLDRLQEMKHLFNDDNADLKLDQMKQLVSGLSSDPGKQKQFVQLLGAAADPHLDQWQVSDDEGKAFLSNRNDGDELLKSLGLPIGAQVDTGAGGASLGIGDGNPAMTNDGGNARAAAGLSDFFNSIKTGAMRLLNLTTYYVMKDRAGKIGHDAVNPLMSRIQSKVDGAKMKFHFVGHSFGGRLVTATVDGPQKLSVQTLLLLQAAYSHNGLALNFDNNGKNGFFHAVFDQKKVAGNILITHTNQDKAVGLAYPLASRLNGDNASAFGDKNDVYGGMGANGAQHLDTADITLLGANGTYNFPALGKFVINLNGDTIITSHGDVARPETALVLASAILASTPAAALAMP